MCICCWLEKQKNRRLEMSKYDLFVNTFMSSLSEADKLKSPLSNMARATKAWMEERQHTISGRVKNTMARQGEELNALGLTEYSDEEHVNLGLPSSLGSGLPSAHGSGDESAALLVDISPQLSPPHLEMHLTSANEEVENAALLANIFPQLSPPHLKKHLTSANGKVEKAVDAILLESPSQNMVNNSNLNVLMQMFPQFKQEGIAKALLSCDNKLYDTVDLLLKLLPVSEESKRRDSPVISFSQTVTRAVSNIPDTDLNPFAVALSSTSTASGSRKAAFCKHCGHYLSGRVMGGLCPNPACGQPFKPKLRM